MARSWLARPILSALEGRPARLEKGNSDSAARVGLRWSPTSKWGHTMLAKKGGYAVQRLYQAQGRVGMRHPAHRASAISASRRKFRKKRRRNESGKGYPQGRAIGSCP